MPLRRIRPAAGRTGTGLSLRRNALDPGFHGVPAGPAHPGRDAGGAGVSWVRFLGCAARPRPAIYLNEGIQVVCAVGGQFSYVTAVCRERSSTKGAAYPAIFPLPFAVRRLGSGRYYGSGNGRGDDVA